MRSLGERCSSAKPYLAVIFLQFGTAGLAIIAKFALKSLNHGMNHYLFVFYRHLVASIVVSPFAFLLERQTIDGVPPSRAHVFLETHKDQKIDPMDEKSRQAVEMMNRKLNDLPNNKEVTNGVIAWDGDIYSQVINEIIGPERRGRVRGLGRGPSSIPSRTCYGNKEGLDNDHVLCNEKNSKFWSVSSRRSMINVSRYKKKI